METELEGIEEGDEEEADVLESCTDDALPESRSAQVIALAVAAPADVVTCGPLPGPELADTAVFEAIEDLRRSLSLLFYCLVGRTRDMDGFCRKTAKVQKTSPGIIAEMYPLPLGT